MASSIAVPAKKSAASMVKRWIMDSGCGHDLIARALVEDFPECIKTAKKALTFNTANGLAPTTDQACLKVKELKQTVHAYVMARSPSVLPSGCGAWSRPSALFGRMVVCHI